MTQNTMDKKLLTLLVCPLCKGELQYDKQADELVCFADNLAYSIRDGIPVMLSNEAREITLAEREAIQQRIAV